MKKLLMMKMMMKLMRYKNIVNFYMKMLVLYILNLLTNDRRSFIKKIILTLMIWNYKCDNLHLFSIKIFKENTFH